MTLAAKLLTELLGTFLFFTVIALAGSRATSLPFIWNKVELRGPGPSSLRSFGCAPS